MAGTTGLEPATSAVTGQRSNQLSYVPTIVRNNQDAIWANGQFAKALAFVVIPLPVRSSYHDCAEPPHKNHSTRFMFG